MDEEKELLLTVKRGKTSYIGHIMRGERGLEIDYTRGISGNRSNGRRKNLRLKDLRHWYVP